MEPAIELAIRITAHLWILRQVFPGAQTVADLDENERWVDEFEAAASKDYALAARIADLAGSGTNQPAMSTAFQGVTRSHYIIQPRSSSVQNFVRHARGALPPDVPENFPPREMLRFRGARLEGGIDSLSRDQVIVSLANWLLRNAELMPDIAHTLEYIPSLAKGLPEQDWADPGRLLTAADAGGIPIPFSMVLREELQHIERSRRNRMERLAKSVLFTGNGTPAASYPELVPNIVPSEQATRMGLFGIALSGGGIRSATFSLGVLQAMADRHVLSFADYLSTVSGGGYIGGWLLAWAKRRGSIHSVEKSLQGYNSDLNCGPIPEDKNAWEAPAIERNTDPMSDDIRPLRYLRTYSRYLAPEAGVFSADTWTILSTWFRNMLLNLLVLIPFLAAALLIPRAAAWLLINLPRVVPSALAMSALGAAFLWGACIFITRNIKVLYKVRARNAFSVSGDSDSKVVFSILPMLVAGAFFSVTALWIGRAFAYPIFFAASGGAVYLVGVFILYAGLFNADSKPVRVGIGMSAVLASTFTGCGLVYLFCSFILGKLAENSQRGTWIIVTVGAPLVLLILSIVAIVFIGIIGSEMSDKAREWWSRLGAWLAILVVAWMALGSLAFFVPLWMAQAGIALLAAGGITWTGITTAGVKLASSFKSGKDGDSSLNPFNSVILALAPYVFIVGLLGIISFAVYSLTGVLLSNWRVARLFQVDSNAQALCCTSSALNFQRFADHYWALMYPGSWVWIALFAVLALVSMFFAWRIDINEFSMQNFYKNRLVRAYLGASRMRQHRWPNAFTAFDPDDDIPLARLVDSDPSDIKDGFRDCSPGFIGPLPIINTALNITRGEDASRQERKAASFVFTPLRSGFDFARKQTIDPESALSEYAFRPTRLYADPEPAGQATGIFLGTAMATSGAAASPNSGFHTSPSLAFLLTIFNVRLGRWIGNPRAKTWRKSAPLLGLGYLLCEMFGQTQTDSKYVQLSDGGHFDNMGLYELIRRRCKYIIICDGEEDADFKLEGIGGAIRKCRVDFGVVIRLDVSRIMPCGTPKFSKTHFAKGTILYPGDPECGTLIYIKASLTNDESVDVREFCKRYPVFPNESTADQFFDESHFESYRALGHHIGQGIFQHDAALRFAGKNRDLALTLKTIFENISEPEAIS